MFKENKNIIVTGNSATGKTIKFFMPTIIDYPGTTIAIGLEGFENKLKQEGFFCMKLEHCKDVNKLVQHKKVFLSFHEPCDPFWYNQGFTTVINYISQVEDNVLLAIDDFTTLDFGEQVVRLYNLLEKNTINVLLLTQSLDLIRKLYKEKAHQIIQHCNTISTKTLIDFSGEFKLRIPKSLHKQLSIEAELEGISLNQYLVYLLSSRQSPFIEINQK